MMKKTHFILPLSMALITLVSFASCDIFSFTIPKNRQITKPGAYVDEAGIHITPVTVSGVEYINIYRTERTDDSATADPTDDTITNLCQLVPVPSDDPDGYTPTPTMTFHDVSVDPTKFYQYMVRYKFATCYKNSEFTSIFKAEKCIGASIEGEKTLVRKTGAETIPIEYSTETYYMTMPLENLNIKINSNSSTSAIRITKDARLTISTDPIEDVKEEDKFDIYMAISNGTLTYLFKMFPLTTNDVNSIQIALRSCIPSNFYDTPLKLKGFVAQKKKLLGQGTAEDGSTSPTYTAYLWSKPMLFDDSNGTENRDFYINDVMQEKDIDKDIDDTFIVPTVQGSADFGDYTDLKQSADRAVVYQLTEDFADFADLEVLLDF